MYHIQLKVHLVLMDRMVLQVHKDRPAPLEAGVALLQVRWLLQPVLRTVPWPVMALSSSSLLLQIRGMQA